MRLPSCVVVALLLFVPSVAAAAPIDYFDYVTAVSISQDFGATSIDLMTAQPPVANPTTYWDGEPYLLASVMTTYLPQDVPLTMTLTLNGTVRATGTIVRTEPFADNSDGQVVYILDFIMGECCYEPQDGAVLISVADGPTHSFAYQVTQPVPEPASIVLLGTGLLAVRRRVDRRMV